MPEPNFLELLVESMGTISATREPDVLEQARVEAERLFGARAEIAPEPAPDGASNGHRLEVPLRASENARLLAEQARLSEQLITAEQDERRRLANELHDGAVQSLSGIALMLDAVEDAIDEGRLEEAKSITASALARHRETIRSLRDLSFSLEPVVLRDQGFSPALRALAESVALSNKIQIDVDVDAAEALSEKAQAGVYQIIREALNQAVRRGPPKRISIRVERTEDGGFDTVISDDAPGERRRRSFDAIAERTRTLNGRLAVEQGSDGGTTVR